MAQREQWAINTTVQACKDLGIYVLHLHMNWTRLTVATPTLLRKQIQGSQSWQQVELGFELKSALFIMHHESNKLSTTRNYRTSARETSDLLSHSPAVSFGLCSVIRNLTGYARAASPQVFILPLSCFLKGHQVHKGPILNCSEFVVIPTPHWAKKKKKPVLQMVQSEAATST